MTSRLFGLMLVLVGLFLLLSPRTNTASASAPSGPRPHVVGTIGTGGQDDHDGLPAPSQQEILSEEVPKFAPPQPVLVPVNLPNYPPLDSDPSPKPNPNPTPNQKGHLAPGTLGPLSRPRTRSTQTSARGGASQFGVVVGGANNTGINPWWSYEEDAIGGVGHYMANVASGNLIIQASDMDVSHHGVDLAFTRSHNSFSQHDHSNTDGSVQGNFGDGWTNTLDAHIAAFTDGNGGSGISVFDVDGARYDYYCTGNPCQYQPPAGQYAALILSQTDGNYYWTKTSGSKYGFFPPNFSTPGMAGRLIRIWGRNRNTWLKFSYCFDSGQPQDSTHLNKIEVETEFSLNGANPCTGTFAAVLSFADFGASGGPKYRLLSTLTWPDTTVVSYEYDNAARLVEVDEPSNNASNNVVPQWYHYSSSGYLITQANGGRWATTNGTDGSYKQFAYYGNSVATVKDFGWANQIPSPPPGADPMAAGPVQPNVATNYGINVTFRKVTFAFPGSSPAPAPAPSPTGAATCSSSGSTPWYDTDQHETIYCVDSTGRDVQTDSWTGTQWLFSKQTWDISNNVTATIDERSNETDYSYDSNGNTTAIGSPQVTVWYNGSLTAMRPTSLFAYDGFNNVTASCDQIWVHAHNGDWPPPSPSPCTAQSGVSSYSYTYQSYEPYGELSVETKPLGYQYQLSYDPVSQQGTDYGTPTKVLGTSFAQNSPDPSIQPVQSFVYDADGNIICSFNGESSSARQYDSLYRVTGIADGDDNGATVSRGTCPTPIPNATIAPQPNTAITRAYFPDGEVKDTQTSAQAIDGVMDSFMYDADGNEIAVTGNTGGAQSTTFMWFDGDDRLVEVQEPSDARSWTPDPYNHEPAMPYDLSGALLTRYYYDLSKGAGVSFGGGAAYQGSGDLFKTVQYLPVGGGTYSWQDVRGNGYDNLDRPTAGYYYAPGDSTAHSSSAAYDTNGFLGLETQSCNGANECSSKTFDALNRPLQVSFSGGQGEPTRTYTYDPNGRTASILSGSLGTQSYAYDAEGRLVTSSEPTLGGVTSPATLTYDYYPNGLKQDLKVSSSAWMQTTTPALQYSYRPDGKLVHERFTRTANGSYDFTWSYTAGGRATSTTDTYMNPSHTYTYDSFGRVQSYSLAAGSYSNLTYDDENEILSNGHQSMQYNVRGELIYEVDGDFKTQFRQQSLYGAMINRPYDCVTNQNPPPTQLCQFQTWDSNTVDYKQGVRTLFVNGDDGLYRGEGWSYDANGRQFSTAGQSTYTRSFDVENHLLSQAFTASPVGNDPGGKYCVETTGGLRVQYSWGPSGHPILVGSTAISTTPPATPPPASQVQYTTLHWDGDVLLFATNAGGQLEDIKVGFLGDLTPLDPSYARLTVWDRDLSGQLVSSHNDSAGRIGGWTAADPYIRGCVPITGHGTWATPAPNFAGPVTFAGGTHHVGSIQYTNLVGQGGLVAEPRMDGIFDGYNHLQGGRNFDSQQSAWTTPDAYPGEVRDPASQRAYMWNRNAPETYSDPTGFYPGVGDWGSGSLLNDDSTSGGIEGGWIVVGGQNLPASTGTFSDFMNARPGHPTGPEGCEGTSCQDKEEKDSTDSAKSKYEKQEQTSAAVNFLMSQGFSVQEINDMGASYTAAQQGVVNGGTLGMRAANWVGKAWVGTGARLLKDGSGWISADGARVFRYAALKQSGFSKGLTQINLQMRNPLTRDFLSNTHITISGP